MSNFLYFHPADNVAPDATWSVDSSATEDTEYPAANIADLSFKNLANPAKVNETGGGWIGDFGSAHRVDFVVLWHNLVAGTACKFQMNASNSWGGPTVDASFVIPAKRANGYTRKVYIDLRSVPGYSTGGFRYCRLITSTPNDEAVGAKMLMFETVREMTRNYKWSFRVEEYATNIDMSTDALIPWTYDLTAAPRLFVADVLPTDDDAERWREWFLSCGGRSKFTVFIPDPTENDAFLARFNTSNTISVVSPGLAVQRFGITRVAHNAYTLQFALEEVTAGDPEWI